MDGWRLTRSQQRGSGSRTGSCSRSHPSRETLWSGCGRGCRALLGRRHRRRLFEVQSEPSKDIIWSAIWTKQRCYLKRNPNQAKMLFEAQSEPSKDITRSATRTKQRCYSKRNPNRAEMLFGAIWTWTKQRYYLNRLPEPSNHYLKWDLN